MFRLSPLNPFSFFFLQGRVAFPRSRSDNRLRRSPGGDAEGAVVRPRPASAAARTCEVQCPTGPFGSMWWGPSNRLMHSFSRTCTLFTLCAKCHQNSAQLLFLPSSRRRSQGLPSVRKSTVSVNCRDGDASTHLTARPCIPECF